MHYYNFTRVLFQTGNCFLPPPLGTDPAVWRGLGPAELVSRDRAQTLPESRLYSKLSFQKADLIEAFKAPFATLQRDTYIAREHLNASREL